MKKLMIIIFLLITIINTNIVYGTDTEEVIKEQEQSLGISAFIKEAQNYTKATFDDISINDLYKGALAGDINTDGILGKILNLVSSEALKTIRTLGYILVIIIIHSIIKSISEGLENNQIGEITYYVQYILIVTLIMTNFSETVVMIKNTINNLVGFINSLLPILLALMITTRKLSHCIHDTTHSFTNYHIYRKFHNSSLTSTYFNTEQHYGIISKISDKVQIDKLSKFFKSSVIWVLGIVLTIFVRRFISRRNTDKLCRPELQ